MAVGGFAAVLAGAILLYYVAQYRDSVKQEQQPVAVLVAQSLIPKGTSGAIIASQSMYTISKIPTNRVQNGAITDPDALKGKIATEDLFPGKQLTESDFVATSASPKVSTVHGEDRAIAIPLDAAHGVIGYIQPGDHVDVMAGFNIIGNDGKTHPILKTIMQNILVLDAPPAGTSGSVGSSNTAQDVLLQMTDQQATELAFSSDNGKVWLTYRAPVGALEHKESLVTIDTLLFGVPPLAITKAYHRLEQQALNGGGN
jgi:pilus assembly protein CpaB